MSEEPRRQTHQSADLDQTNDQKVDQANTQDASHHSEARQDVAFTSQVSHSDNQRVTLIVQNQMSPAAPQTGTLAGQVLDADGCAVAGSAVAVFFGPLVGMPVAVLRTDAVGRFRAADLPPGFYSLRVTGPDGHRTEQWNLRVTAGSECHAHVLLSEGVTAPTPGRRRPSTTPQAQ